MNSCTIILAIGLHRKIPNMKVIIISLLGKIPCLYHALGELLFLGTLIQPSCQTNMTSYTFPLISSRFAESLVTFVQPTTNKKGYVGDTCTTHMGAQAFILLDGTYANKNKKISYQKYSLPICTAPKNHEHHKQIRRTPRSNSKGPRII